MSSRPAEKRAWPRTTGGYGGAGDARTQAWPDALIAADINAGAAGRLAQPCGRPDPGIALPRRAAVLL
ncbi:hypothetical protein MMEU_5196 [Mycobacterium marinum str. Europe]|nr:hypothetical protein MMEU_5196 [Mycobacterium marinum str. Europe]